VFQFAPLGESFAGRTTSSKLKTFSHIGTWMFGEGDGVKHQRGGHFPQEKKGA
jgi:hypothetical protein